MFNPSLSGEINSIVDAIDSFNAAARAWNNHLEEMESLASDLEMAQEEVEGSIATIEGLLETMQKITGQPLPEVTDVDEVELGSI